MVDAERLLSLLGRVTSRLAILDDYATVDRESLLDRDLAGVMAGAGGFRNVLVHGYAEVDDGQVVDHLANLPALRRFVATMTAMLSA